MLGAAGGLRDLIRRKALRGQEIFISFACHWRFAPPPGQPRRSRCAAEERSWDEGAGEGSPAGLDLRAAGGLEVWAAREGLEATRRVSRAVK